jgi:hypothetical protein
VGQDRRVKQKGEDRQESRENTEQLRNRDSNTAQHYNILKKTGEDRKECKEGQGRQDGITVS